jgi:acetyl-CoA carboxylase biotin carboxylase subunit
VHLFERDCTVQRRHQKLIEEAPSTYLNPQMREKLGRWAIQAAESVSYTGAGTVEFICASPDEAYFMEMNTRIQVEHPVTEMITGVDLIAEQLRVAEGLPLSIKQADLKIHGHAIEVRINAEDPAKNFQPSPGCIQKLQLPHGPFCRVDTHIYEGYEIPEFYDSMIAKFISWGVDRPQAMARMRAMLSEFHCMGIDTTAPYHEAVLQNERFIAGNYSTRFVEEEALNGLTQIAPDPEPTLALLELMRTSHMVSPLHETSAWSQVARLESQQRMV